MTPKSKRRVRTQAVNANRALQLQWDGAAGLIDDMSEILGEIPRATLGHPNSRAQFSDLLIDLEAARDSLRAICRWEVKRFNDIPQAEREAASDCIVTHSKVQP